jgi:hypothetical protein
LAAISPETAESGPKAAFLPWLTARWRDLEKILSMEEERFSERWPGSYSVVVDISSGIR